MFEDIKNDEALLSRFFRPFADKYARAMDSSWYKRAVDQHSIEPESFVFSVPFDAGTYHYPFSTFLLSFITTRVFLFSRQPKSTGHGHSRGFHRAAIRTQSTGSGRRFTVSTFFVGLSFRQYHFDGKFPISYYNADHSAAICTIIQDIFLFFFQ